MIFYGGVKVRFSVTCLQGELETMGTYDKLLGSGIDFSRMLAEEEKNGKEPRKQLSTQKSTERDKAEKKDNDVSYILLSHFNFQSTPSSRAFWRV